MSQRLRKQTQRSKSDTANGTDSTDTPLGVHSLGCLFWEVAFDFLYKICSYISASLIFLGDGALVGGANEGTTMKQHTSASAKRALSLATSVLLATCGLTACGGGGDDGNSNLMTTAGAGASQPESATILELNRTPVRNVVAGNYFMVTFQVRCEGSEGKCQGPVKVGSFSSRFGVVEQLLYYPVGGTVQNFVGSQSGDTFVPITAVSVDRSGVIEVYVKTGQGDIAPEPREWTITATYLQGSGSVEVVGVQAIVVAPAPRRIDL